MKKTKKTIVNPNGMVARKVFRFQYRKMRIKAIITRKAQYEAIEGSKPNECVIIGVFPNGEAICEIVDVTDSVKVSKKSCTSGDGFSSLIGLASLNKLEKEA